jgi:hypothetical protein
MRTGPFRLPAPLALALVLAACAPGTDAPDASEGAAPPASSADAARPAVPPPPSNDASPPDAAPRGVLPLQRGVYVMAGDDCTAPANAGLRFYDGRGISGTATHACETIVRSQDGDRFDLDQSCIDTPAGDGPRTVEPQVVTVHDERTFTLSTDRGTTRFSHCPDEAVPPYLRERAGLEPTTG